MLILINSNTVEVILPEWAIRFTVENLVIFSKFLVRIIKIRSRKIAGVHIIGQFGNTLIRKRVIIITNGRFKRQVEKEMGTQEKNLLVLEINLR
jgi:hypothetical protein